jgi:hypothetical protein
MSQITADCKIPIIQEKIKRLEEHKSQTIQYVEICVKLGSTHEAEIQKSNIRDFDKVLKALYSLLSNEE